MIDRRHGALPIVPHVVVCEVTPLYFNLPLSWAASITRNLTEFFALLTCDCLKWSMFDGGDQCNNRICILCTNTAKLLARFEKKRIHQIMKISAPLLRRPLCCGGFQKLNMDHDQVSRNWLSITRFIHRSKNFVAHKYSM